MPAYDKTKWFPQISNSILICKSRFTKFPSSTSPLRVLGKLPEICLKFSALLQPYSPVTRSGSSRTALGCGRTGDSWSSWGYCENKGRNYSATQSRTIKTSHTGFLLYHGHTHCSLSWLTPTYTVFQPGEKWQECADVYILAPGSDLTVQQINPKQIQDISQVADDRSKHCRAPSHSVRLGRNTPHTFSLFI